MSYSAVSAFHGASYSLEGSQILKSSLDAHTGLNLDASILHDSFFMLG
jgi:hypothetical protein